MYPGDPAIISQNGLWKFSFASSGDYISLKSVFTDQVYWSASFSVSTKLYVNKCGVYAYNLFTQNYRGNIAPSGACASFAYGLMVENSGVLAIVDSSGNSVTGSNCCSTGVVFDTGTAQDLCAPGKYSATGAIPCFFCPAGLKIYFYTYFMLITGELQIHRDILFS
jgi:hypothetical protein